jgi:hypothetical protein
VSALIVVAGFVSKPLQYRLNVLLRLQVRNDRLAKRIFGRYFPEFGVGKKEFFGQRRAIDLLVPWEFVGRA